MVVSLPISPEVLRSLPELVNLLRIGWYLDVAMMALYVFDYFLTFSMETSLIWPAPWKPTKFLFLFNRYFIIIDFSLNHFRDQVPQMARHCPAILQAIMWVYIIGSYMVEFMFTLRAWLVWHKNKFVIAGTLAYTVASFAVSITLAERAIIPLEYFDVRPLTGCLANFSDPNFYVAYTMIGVYDIVLLVLMLVPFIREYLGGDLFTRTRLFRVVYTEGIIFYVLQIMTSMTILVLTLKFPKNVLMSLYVFRVTRAILSNRVILHIRQVYENRIIANELPQSINIITIQ